MKIICNTIELAEACTVVQRSVPQKSTLPATEGILMEAKQNVLQLTGYDLEVGITTSINCRCERDGSAVLNSKLLCDILHRLPGETVALDIDEHNLCKITSGESEFSLISIPADDYPELPTVSGGLTMNVKQNLLKDMIRQTIFAVAVTDAKPVHKGVKFELSEGNLRLIAVDGFRLAIRNEPLEYSGADLSFVVPAKTLGEVIKLVSDDDSTIQLIVGQKYIIFEIGAYRIISRLLIGDFFNYKNAIPSDNSTIAIVNLDQLLNSVERTALLITSKLKSPIRCVFDNDSVKMSSTTSLGAANDRISAQISGNRVEIGFNNSYLSDCLRTIDCDKIKIELNGPVSPMILRPLESDSFIFLIIPMRLKNEGIQ